MSVFAQPRAASQLDGLFTARVRFGVGAALGQANAAVVFRVPEAGQWTLHLAAGRVNLRRGGARHAAVEITADAETMAAILEGTCSGVQAFLEGRLTMRGNISLALQIDGAFDVGRRPITHSRARTVSTGGVSTFYLEAGAPDSPPVLLLHGLGGTAASMLPLMAALAGEHRVLVPDLPGFGASSAPPWRYRIEDFAAWLLEFIDTLGLARTAIVGNSLGGRIAIEVGLTDPDRVRRLVLLCPSPAFRRMRQFVPVVRLVSPNLGLIPFWTSHRLTVETIRLMFARPERLSPQWYDAAADEFRRVMSSPAHRRAFVAAMCQIYVEPAYGAQGFWDRLPALRVPALFIWGDRDRLVPARFARHVLAAVPHAKSEVLTDCGHVPQFELPERTATLTRRFLAQAAHSRQII